jgi:hypothetical protein
MYWDSDPGSVCVKSITSKSSLVHCRTQTVNRVLSSSQVLERAPEIIPLRVNDRLHKISL